MSAADTHFTNNFGYTLDKMRQDPGFQAKLRAHVVINHRQYSYLPYLPDASGRMSIRSISQEQSYDLDSEPTTPLPGLLGKSFPMQAEEWSATIARGLLKPSRKTVTLIALSTDHEVRAVVEMPARLIRGPRGLARARRLMRNAGAASLVGVYTEGASSQLAGLRNAGLLIESVQWDGSEARTRSESPHGAITMGRRRLEPRPGAKYSAGEITVMDRRLYLIGPQRAGRHQRREAPRPYLESIYVAIGPYVSLNEKTGELIPTTDRFTEVDVDSEGNQVRHEYTGDTWMVKPGVPFSALVRAWNAGSRWMDWRDQKFYDEEGRWLDAAGREIPEGQQDMLPPFAPARSGITGTSGTGRQELSLTPPPSAPARSGITGTSGTGDLFGPPPAGAPARAAPPAPPGQGRLFASRPAATTPAGVSPVLSAAAGPVSTPRPDRIQVGGGDYSLRQFGRLDDRELRILTSVMDDLEEPIAGQRRGTRTWDATEQAAINLLQLQHGLTLDSLVRRKAGSTANAEQLEAYGMLLVDMTRRIREVAARVSGTQHPSADDLARLAELREKLGILMAPAMGYRTEAGRSLNILRKMAGDFRTADDILAQMGDGTTDTLTRFARVLNETGSVDQALGITRASYVPGLWDKFYEVWINGLLSGPTTHAVNLVSNAIFNALEGAAGIVAAVTSQHVHARAEMARFAALPHGITLGLKNAAIAFREERGVLTPEVQIEQHQRAIEGPAGRMVRLPGRALQAEDEFFKAIGYQGQLARLAMEQAIRTNPGDVQAEFHRILGNPLAHPQLVKAARKEAARLTFTTPLGPHAGAYARLANKTRFLRLITPFIRTPVNILKEATRYTPGAPLLQDVRSELSAGGRDAAMAWSRMATGSGIMLAFAALAAQGILSGAGPEDDEERAQLMRQGWRPYSLRLPSGAWMKYNRFEPFGMLTGMAADLFEVGSTMQRGEYDRVGAMLMTSLATNLGDKTFLRGVTEFSQAYSDPQRYLERWAMGMATSIVPNAVAQTARWLDPYQREANTLLEQFRAKLPGASEKLAARLDLAGEPIERDTGIPGNPIAQSRPRTDPLAATMLRLGVNRNAPGRLISVRGTDYKLQGELYSSYKGFLQKARYAALTPLVSSPQFRALEQSNPARAQALLEKHWDDIGRDARLAWLWKNIGSLDNPQQARRSALATSYQVTP